jgi:hypothetical protein
MLEIFKNRLIAGKVGGFSKFYPITLCYTLLHPMLHLIEAN